MKSWNRYTEEKLSNIFRRLKRARVELFVKTLKLGPDDIILDLGSENGSYLSEFYPYPQNIVIADIAEEPMKIGVEKFGLKGYRLIPSEGTLPFEDNEFDAVWCNSVIEHVTLSRSILGKVSDEEFEERAGEHQQLFASEIDRVGKKYFVQTPYVHFPVESHSWMPLIPYFTQPVRWWIGQKIKKFWIKQWTADFYLYNRQRFVDHFSQLNELHIERAFGLPKSLIAIKFDS